ncbi:hypothetical protein M2108_003980 [Paenibacillus sp. PastM-3]|nr:S-layer homology domain-containing protein [Paenibacillus sp. PastM-3]MDH6509002.1 hypothetical protein [Paenibacillus sp. PastM-3]
MPEVAAAAEAGIVQGKNNNVFEPDSLITREEMVVMMMRAYSLKSGGVSTVPTNHNCNLNIWGHLPDEVWDKVFELYKSMPG